MSRSSTRTTSQSNADWVSRSLLTAKTIAAGAESLPFPYVKGVFGIAVILLETIEKVKKNREDLKELCGETLEIMKIVQDQISAHGETAAVKFKSLCEDLEVCLQDVLHSVRNLQVQSGGFRSRFREIVKLASTTDQIIHYQNRIRTLRSNFVLTATIDTNFQVHKLTAQGSDVPAPQVTPSVNNCPPPSRIFHGRQTILDKMHQYFMVDLDKQHIFLLHGLGGAGKTQIALKFIEQSSQFTDIFLLDTSTIDTINTGLKTIAVTKNIGTTSQEALQWLSCEQNWLLFFDNADDPKINLNRFFPRCNHGSILITSRNPGLRVYAGSYSLVSDMEETDAIKLLLTCSAEEITPASTLVATGIVKELSCLPLAIIQAGAFIAKSGDLGSYLELYLKNRDRLLSEKPAQSHDDYAWTVYTTWQTSFEKLTSPAATLLQLWSFLHYKGIPEQIFSRASIYQVKPYGPTEEELQKPLEFLSQFLAPTGVWDSLLFMDVTNELRAYSLVNFDPRTKMFSIHPLVHSWSQSTVTELKLYHYCMTALVGMLITAVDPEEGELAIQLSPHVDSLVHDETQVPPGFELEYGVLYYYSSRAQKAEKLLVIALDKRKTTMGEDTLDTLVAIHHLATTYNELGRSKEAESLQVVALQKGKEILGEDHPNILTAMNNLALMYFGLGRYQEAEKLLVVVFQKNKAIFGEDNPVTLTVMGNLALTYSALSQLTEAKELEVEVLEKRKEISGDDHKDTLKAMVNLASTHKELGQLKEAEELEAAIHNKRQEIHGEDHLDTLIAMGNLAIKDDELGRWKDAEALGRFVLEKRMELLGEDHANTLTAMGNLAATYMNLGQFEKAEELEVTVLQKQRKNCGENHPHTLIAAGNLAWTYHEQGRLKEAEELGIMVLQKRKEILGEDHGQTLTATGNLACTYQYMGRFKEAEELEVVVLQKQRKICGEDHPDTLIAAGNLAWTYHEQGRLKEAVELGVMVLEKRKKILGEDHVQTLTAMANLASTYMELGRFNDAEVLEIGVLEKRRTLLGEDHLDTLLAMAQLATTYYNHDRFEDAEQLEQVVLEKRKKILGDEHPKTLTAMGNLAATYRNLGKLKEAEEIEVVVLEKRTENLGKDHPDTIWAMGNLAWTYHQLGRFTESQELAVIVLEKRKKILGDTHRDTLLTMERLKETYEKLGKSEDVKSMSVLIEKAKGSEG